MSDTHSSPDVIFDDETSLQSHRVAGLVAKSGGHEISTPIMTLGIRGMDSLDNTAAGEGSKIKLYPAAVGRAGAW